MSDTPPFEVTVFIPLLYYCWSHEVNFETLVETVSGCFSALLLRPTAVPSTQKSPCIRYVDCSKSLPARGEELALEKTNREFDSEEGAGRSLELEEWVPNLLSLLCRPEAPNEFYDGDHDNDKESDVEI